MPFNAIPPPRSPQQKPGPYGSIEFNPSAPLSNNLVSLLLFDGGQSPAGLHDYANKMQTFTQIGATGAINWGTGPYGSTATSAFGGTKQLVAAKGVASTGNYSISALCKFGPATNITPVLWCNQANTVAWVFYNQATDKIASDVVAGSADVSGVIPTGWHRLTVTFGVAGVTCYVDGKISGTTVGGTNTLTTWLLFNTGSLWWDYPTSDIFIWTRALSATDVAMHAANPYAMLRPRFSERWRVGIVAATTLPPGETTIDTRLPGYAKRGVSPIDWTDNAHRLVAGKDTFFNGPGNGPDYDYPNPRGPIPAVELRTWINALRLRSQDTFFGLGGSPQFTWPVPKPPTPSAVGWSDVYKLSLNFVVFPFSQDDWPNPRAALPVPQGWLDPYRLSLNAVFLPFSQGAWPNPNGPLYANALRTWVEPLAVNLQGADTFFGLGGNPLHDWPVPKPPPPLVQGWTGPLQVNLQSQDTFFGLAGNPQRDWPNPGRPAPLTQAWTDAYKIALNILIVPFGQGDWPNPRAVSQSIGLRTWVDAFKGQGADAFFGLAGSPQYDWPVPRRAAPLVQSWSDSFHYTLNVIAAPFVQGSWPNPAGPVYAIALRTWLDPSKSPHVDTFFGLAGNPTFDWPVPTAPRPKFLSSLRTWTDPMRINLRGSDRFFGLGGSPQHDWPVPLGAAPGASFKTWAEVQQNASTPIVNVIVEYQYFARRRMRR